MAVQQVQPGDAAQPFVMRAWQYGEYGGGADALQLNSLVPVPAPGAGELLLRVQAASVNPVDWKLQNGFARGMLPPHFPFTSGFDVAGEVVHVGPHVGTPTKGAQVFAKGDQVFASLDIRRAGGFAEYAVVPARACALRPPAVAPAEAACFGVAGLTALQALRDWGKLPMGKQVEACYDAPRPHAPAPASASDAASASALANVLVANAAGGVGHYAIQLAKLAGAHVTATCGARNLDLMRSLGADEVLDYKSPEGAALRSPSGRKYDVLVDCTMSLSWSQVAPALAPTGRWVHLSPNAGVMVNTVVNAVVNALSPFPGQRLFAMIMAVDAADLAALGRLSAEGLLKTRIDTEVPFDRAPDGWRASMAGHVTGKVVVSMDK